MYWLLPRPQVLFSRLLNLLPGEQVLGVVRAVGEDPGVQHDLARRPRDAAALQDLGFVVFQKVRIHLAAACQLPSNYPAVTPAALHQILPTSCD
jgi:hypothetical protein